MLLTAQLEKIETSGLIRLAQQNPELEYMFRHALVQDATYESLLRADRRTLHQAVGQTLASLYADRLDEVASTLALHFEKAEEWGAAVDYYIRAGEAASRIYAMEEAIAFFRRAIEIFPPSTSTENLTHLYSQYGRVLELAGRFDAVIDVYEQMRVEAVQRNDLDMELDALMARAILHSTPSPHYDYTISASLCERALHIAEALNHREAISRTYWILMLSTFFEGRLPEAVAYGEKSLAIARTLNKPERLAFVLNDIARTYYAYGMIEQGVAANLEARALWQALGNLPMLVDNLATYAEYLFIGGEYHRAIEFALQASEIAKSINNFWGQTFCLMILAFSYAELGEIENAIQTDQELMAFDPRQTFISAQIAGRGQLALIYAEFGDRESGYPYLQAALKQAAALDNRFGIALMAGKARYHLFDGQLIEAEAAFAKSTEGYDPENFGTFAPTYIENARYALLIYKGEYLAALEALDKMLSIAYRLQIKFCLPEFMLHKANTLLLLARKDEALTILQALVSLCKQMDARIILWKACALIGQLQLELGQLSAAKLSFDVARETIYFLRDHLPADLRQSFLKLPEVAKLLENKSN